VQAGLFLESMTIEYLVPAPDLNAPPQTRPGVKTPPRNTTTLHSVAWGNVLNR
jgi:hypothetical protein